MNIKSKVLLKSASGLLVQYLEVMNKIEEKDFLEIVKKAATRKKHLKNIHDNVDRGNPFMMVFFVRELIENILNE